MRQIIATTLTVLLAAGQFVDPAIGNAQAESTHTATPIKHVVVIFGENISFDHYWGTYPNATNPHGEPRFKALAGTPSVNGLTSALLTLNPNSLNSANGTGATNPFRLDRSQAATADQDHNYAPEQEASHMGLMDAFPEFTGTPGPPPKSPPAILDTTGLVMGYYDGNTVTALWNYAQHFAINDNSYGTTFGPSTPGALNLISGQTNGVSDMTGASSKVVGDGSGGYTDIGDADPIGDVCSTSSAQIHMSGQNIGDLLNTAGVTWGWFEGGFDLTKTNPNGTKGCMRSHTSTITNDDQVDYIPHHEPFQYYDSTENSQHARPSSVWKIGYNDGAVHHQYDMDDFYTAVSAGNMPAVSFLKAPGYQDAHAGYSDPLDEQTFVVDVIDFLMTRPEWSSTAVFINYDDSDGWYDHQLGSIVNQSTTAVDMLTGDGQCGNGSAALPGVNGVAHAQGRCGYGPRIPLMLISPWAKANYVDHTLTDQTSIIHFIEDNWLSGKRIGDGSFDAVAGPVNNMFDFSHLNWNSIYLLYPATGEPINFGW